MFSACAVVPAACSGGTSALPPISSVSDQQCAGVPVASGAAGSIYEIPSGVGGTAADCAANAAYRAGQVVVAYNDSSALAGALGAQGWSASGEGDNDQYSYNGTDNQLLANGAPIAVATVADRVSVYAAYRDAASDAPVYYSATAPDITTARADVSAWAAGPAQPLSFAAVRPQAGMVRPQSLQAPTYDVRAWVKVAEYSWRHDTNYQHYPGETSDKNHQGTGSGYVTVYRLNTNDNVNDYFLVDVTYAQGPDFVYCSDLFTCFFYNKNATIAAELQSANGTAGRVVEVSPVTIVSRTSETISVGGKISGKVTGGDRGPGGEVGGEISAGWSRTITTESVDTTTTSGTGVGTAKAGWTDNYNRSHDNIPNAAKSTFTADRLAIFSLPRDAIYNNTGNAAPTLKLTLRHEHAFEGYWTPAKNFTTTGRSDITVGVVLPTFFLRGNDGPAPATNLSLNLKPGTSATFQVVANQYAGQKTLRWNTSSRPSFVTTSIDPNGEVGNQTVTVNALPNAAPGSVDYLNLNTAPPGGADALRNGSLRVQISIVAP